MRATFTRSAGSVVTPSPSHRIGASRAWLDARLLAVFAAAWLDLVLAPCEARAAQQWEVFETTFASATEYAQPFTAVQVDVVFRHSEREWIVPAFWAGDRRWTVRFAPPLPGEYTYRVRCSDPGNPGLNRSARRLRVTAYSGHNPFRQHGFLRLSADRRHFEHADGTPFLWLADTWWKGLCRRLTWEGFRELTADRRAKGFNAVQIVCGPYPDEAMLEARWQNEGGLPYPRLDFSEVNPRYFEFADRRLQHLVEAGIVPVIVGGWGRPQAGGRSTLDQVGLEGFKRHWRQLIARYGAYPVVWIAGGEAKDAYGPWSELANYIRAIDPYHHPLGYHAPGHPRREIQDQSAFDFDMVAIGHDGYSTAAETLKLLQSCRSLEPTRPVLCGEACYEGHMQTNFQDVQRHLFWSCLLSGAAGHTYGAAGVWQAGVDGDPGIDPVYDHTSWREGLRYPGSAQVGIGKHLLEQYPWASFEPHAEWTDAGAFAAGIPGNVRFIYQPRRRIYDWSGVSVKHLEPGVPYRGFYFDPVSAKRYELGTFLRADAAPESLAERGDSVTVPAPPIARAAAGKANGAVHRVAGEAFRAPNVPSPQDWVLVLEAVPRH